MPLRPRTDKSVPFAPARPEGTGGDAARPEDAEKPPMLETEAFSAALVAINVVPLVCLVANLVYYTWASKKKTRRRANNRTSASANDPSGSGQRTPAPAGSHQIVPMTAPEPEEDTHEQHVEAIHRIFSQHEAGLQQRQEKRQQKSKANFRFPTSRVSQTPSSSQIHMQVLQTKRATKHGRRKRTKQILTRVANGCTVIQRATVD